MSKVRSISVAHALFYLADVRSTCTWPGTKWDGDQLLPCGEPTIGNGLFCDPSHQHCVIESVCERHKHNVKDWSVYE